MIAKQTVIDQFRELKISFCKHCACCRLVPAFLRKFAWRGLIASVRARSRSTVIRMEQQRGLLHGTLVETRRGEQ